MKSEKECSLAWRNYDICIYEIRKYVKFYDRLHICHHLQYQNKKKTEAFPQMKVINIMTIKSKIQTINYGISAVNPIFGGGKITPCEMTTKIKLI